MLRTTKWKVEKSRVKVVFRLQFHATNIPQNGWEKLFVCFIPTESGKIIAKTSKANVRNGTCKWADPIYETTRLVIDSRNKRYDDKLYNLIVGMGTSHASILGETIINLADFADASDPFVVSLPLHGSEYGTILHVTVQLLTGKTGFREFEQQFDRGLQSSSNLNRDEESSFPASSSELQLCDDNRNKEFSDTTIEYNGSCNASNSYYADNHDSSGKHESRNSNGPDHEGRNLDLSVNNGLAIAREENRTLRGSLEMAESLIFELKQELITLHSHANEMSMETGKITDHLTNEISSSQKLEREIRMLRSDCSKFKDELEQLKEIKLRSNLESLHDQGDRRQLVLVNGLLLVEDRIRVLIEKVRIGLLESDMSFIHPDLEVLLGIVRDLEKGTVQEPGFARGFDLEEGQSSKLLSQLNEAKVEKGNLVKKMNEMEYYYEALVQELEENRDRTLAEFQKLRYEHSTCVYSISTCKSETESIRHCMKDQILKFNKERYDLSCINEELNNRVLVAEALVQELEEKQEKILGEFKSLKKEHSTCADTVSTCKSKMELACRDLSDQAFKFAKERHDMCTVNEDLEKRVRAAESLVQNLDKNREKVMGEFQSLKREHLTCGDIISTCKSETEFVRNEMNNQKLKFAKERDEMSCVNEELMKRISELVEKHERILGEFQSLQNEHSICVDIISNYKSEIELIRCDTDSQMLEFAKERRELDCIIEELEKNYEQISVEYQSLKNEHAKCEKSELLYHDMKDQILKFSEERDELSRVNKELEEKIFDLEKNRDQILEEFRTLKNEHATCVETESIHHDMKDQILKLTIERDELSCVSKELEKRIFELEKNREQILGEFQSLKNEHSMCAETESIHLHMKEHISELEKEFQDLKDEHSTCGAVILTCKTETDSIVNGMKDQISILTKENYDLSCHNGKLKEMISELEKNRKQILEEFESLKNEHSTCADTISICKAETESIRLDMNDRMLKFAIERDDFDCHNKKLKKKVLDLESALERARINYSVAVTQLQKNLDMLALQVSSLFETNQNLIKRTFSESSVPFSENFQNKIATCCEKQTLGGHHISDKELNEICCANLYLDVYSVSLEKQIYEASVYAKKMKEKMNEYAQKLRLSPETNKREGRSESLRLAFMKEQCETTVQDLKQQLFVSKRNGDDILIKLQDALDEIDIRKKSEASYLKKIEDMSLKIVGSEGELQSVQAELECAFLNLECCKEENKKIVTLLQQCEEEKLKIGFELSLLREQISQRDENSLLSMISGSSFQDIQGVVLQLHKANEELASIYPNYKDFHDDGNALKRVLALEIELAETLTVKKKSSIQFQSSFLKQHSDEEAVFKSFRDINELIRETLEIKSKYVNVETELNDMHERYSQLSLKFAEVEGERQKLMMTLKNVRSPRNIKRSSSETLDKNVL
ncbi:uncharacterized protein [Rutidosis leptorrhynchoides]|uniref:uncharacterized protein n=1 Tax=Rutidosis leptorrhynchoides TaxID=125765 RepID=UPI003A99F568